MKKRLFLILTLLALCASAQAQGGRVVTAAQANGTYRSGKNTFKILALGNNRLKVQFDGVYITASGSPNMGYAQGEARIDFDVATFAPPDTEGCKITLKFLPNKLVVLQEGGDFACGFGHNVTADGTYRKVSNAKPKFDEN
ncbi:MAG TPA: hypothetical protein VKA70_14475 [Blastocatellia bacterium]|nr:hypothetical protein [Blastocatellia bacterium]